MQKRDEELILELQQGNEEALEMLFQRYKVPILNFAMRILGNRADAEDITGEVFLVLFEKNHMYKPTAKFKTWLYTVARNACISRIRKQRRTMSLWFSSRDGGSDYEQWDIPASDDIPREELVKREAAIQVRKAIHNLPETQKEAIVLREYHKMSYAEISEVLDCSLEKVKILIFRARARLRDDLPSLIMEDNDG